MRTLFLILSCQCVHTRCASKRSQVGSSSRIDSSSSVVLNTFAALLAIVIVEVLSSELSEWKSKRLYVVLYKS